MVNPDGYSVPVSSMAANAAPAAGAIMPAKDDLTLSLDAFIRSVGVRRATPHTLFLGAGASVSSGVPSAPDASGNGNGISSSRTIPVWRTNFQNCPFPACSAGYSIGSTSKGYTQKRARPESTVFTSVSAFPSQMIGALTFRRRCAGAAVYRLPVAIPSRAGRPHSFRLDHEFRRASRSRRTPSATTSKHLLKERRSARTSCAMRTELSSG
jgi:hypothetical protein